MRDPLTPRTDVYGLGVLLFELLTNTRPFRASDAYPHADASLEARYPQLIEAPQKLRRATPDRKFATKLQHTISRALATAPHDRYESVAEFLRALDSFTHIKAWPRDAVRGLSDFSPFT
jgi:serine/threonine protein kinase